MFLVVSLQSAPIFVESLLSFPADESPRRVGHFDQLLNFIGEQIGANHYDLHKAGLWQRRNQVEPRFPESSPRSVLPLHKSWPPQW